MRYPNPHISNRAPFVSGETEVQSSTVSGPALLSGMILLPQGQPGDGVGWAGAGHPAQLPMAPRTAPHRERYCQRVCGSGEPTATGRMASACSPRSSWMSPPCLRLHPSPQPRSPGLPPARHWTSLAPGTQKVLNKCSCPHDGGRGSPAWPVPPCSQGRRPGGSFRPVLEGPWLLLSPSWRGLGGGSGAKVFMTLSH